ncbi:MMPL family transporter [Actinacidiphila bryophytorum]|uniref:Drug exporter of the RND superfamily n=1 Tax=Actinacidiphila bryophytorum TaxID=1436133 RepID=A0A9W4E5K8_9ACTN|nr:MMPL family transporter [Actinacidiphila bryophytorum]MBM9434418.1 MMPL family transporter [Actinacidiphila bryophytorum]MBN6543342.1 MMPL family transporter [Actinacidiphila bryophytorum]CAG7625831.1 Putative drug exporter of the RND superfamily [Actinacidiphila bryophytorum]
MSDVNRAGAVGGWTRVVTARPRLTLLLALVFTALTVVAGSGVGDRLSSGGFEAPGSQSSYATAALADRFPDSQPNLVLLVDTRGADLDSAAVAAQGRQLARRLAADPDVVGVSSYWDTRAPVLRAKDGGSAMIAARLRGDDDAVAKEVKRIAPLYRGARGPVRVSVGGNAEVLHEMQTTIQQDLVRAEMIALPITLVLLVMVFGSAVAALLPLGIGIIAILGTSAVLRGITGFTDVSVFAENLTTALGLGLAIDYALFIVRRFREELAAGAAPRSAVATTLRTAGRTVLFSALTVAAALSAMLVFPQYFLRSFAYAGVAVVLLAAGAALIVLPAALVLLGDRVNALDLRVLMRRRRGRSEGLADAEPGARYAALARLVMRRAPAFAVGAVAALLLLGLPFLQVQFGTADDRQLPSAAESHVVQQHLRADYAGSPVGAITVLAEHADSAGLADYRRKVAALPGVVRVEGPVAAKGDAGSAYLTVIPAGASVDSGPQHLVGEIRALPTDFRASVTGQAAVLVDTKHAIAQRLPWAAGIIGLVTLLLVFLLTGSVLVPVQAVLLNALSLTAMFGAVVWVFQDGHLSGLLGFTSTGSIETTLPVLMFCVAFGLSMDYGVFLLSRIKEEYDRTGDHQASIVFGLRRTGGLITAAAVILAVVMVGVGMSRVTNTKMLGLGIALAVLMDAMVIRTLLVPAVMRLTGRATWWAPPVLRRFHDRFGISEGGGPQPPAGAEKGAAPHSGEMRDPEPVSST